MRIVATADTHFPFGADMIPDGDVFIHAGDLMYNGYVQEWQERLDSLAALDHKVKLYCPGNHDFHPALFEGIARAELRRNANTRMVGVGSEGTIDVQGYKLLAVPYVTGLKGWAFNVQEDWLLEYMRNFDDVDIVVSHSPPYKILDCVNPSAEESKHRHVGSLALNQWFYALEKKPKVWICGHIHESYGRTTIDGCTFYNVAMCDGDYNQSNKPMVIDLL